MKSISLALCILLGTASWAWADNAAMAATLSAVEHTIMGGTVKSVTLADPAKDTESEIVVKDATWKLTHILVTPTTTLWNADNKAIMLDKIAVKSKVNIIYLATDEGLNIGKSIKILK